jgi:hypothetical protein
MGKEISPTAILPIPARTNWPVTGKAVPEGAEAPDEPGSDWRGACGYADGIGHPVSAQASIKWRISVGEEATIRSGQPVAHPCGRRRHAHDGLVEVRAPVRAVDAGVTIGEDAAVGGHHPPVGCGDGDRVGALCPGYGRAAEVCVASAFIDKGDPGRFLLELPRNPAPVVPVRVGLTGVSRGESVAAIHPPTPR